jgi:DNA-binding HxlR family transcriptional regulator
MARHSNYTCVAGCPVEATLDLIGGKWKGLLLFHLLDGTQRFNALRRGLPGVTQRMLTKQLRGLVHRRTYAEVPPRVEYRLTDLGHSLRPIILAMRSWGVGYLQLQAAQQAAAELPGGAGAAHAMPGDSASDAR